MDSSVLLQQIKQFKKGQLNKVQIRHTDEDGIRHIETIDENGQWHLQRIEGDNTLGYVVDTNPDLQVGIILPELFLSSVDVAAEITQIESLGITHILNVASNKIEYYPGKLIYRHVRIMDLPQTYLTRYFPECFQFINEAISSGGRVLVHCMAGVSRSAAVVIGYMMTKQGMSFEEAYEYVKDKRPVMRPNDGFMEQLKQFDAASFYNTAKADS